MDGLVKLALAGTARAGGSWPPAATPVDALVPAAGDLSAERRVLLTAGARAIYRQAGVSPRAVPAPATAPDDATPPCPDDASRLLARLLAGEQIEVLPEALERLRLAGRRLPHALLPAALEAGSRKADLRPLLLATLGERGRWLAAQHQPWRWATARPPADGGKLPTDAETIWEEGLSSERLAILRLLRASDPARAREWLARAWKAEKAEFRADALGALAAGLSPDDEPFLESALDDRGQAVRTAATQLLARLPESALGARLRERADHFLTFTPGILAGGWRAAARALARGETGGHLAIRPPEAYDPAWARDGIAEKPPPGTGDRAWWLRQFLALVAPAHWSGRFDTGPDTLIAAVRRSDWEAAMLEGWTAAAVRHRDGPWAAALWRYWAGERVPQAARQRAGGLIAALLGCLPPEEAERLLGEALAAADEAADDRLLVAVQHLPRPWSARFGEEYLRHLRDYLDRVGGTPGYHGGTWLYSLQHAAVALPPACFDAALAAVPAGPLAGGLSYWQRALETMVATIGIRRQLIEEIPL